jgi:SAM-dependent methyltransferase
MSNPVTAFYDGLSPEYRDNMGWDWDAAVGKEGAALDHFITLQLGHKGPHSLLDCSCGIGTQAIGLALKGHRIHASDLSPVSIEQASGEATRLGVNMTFSVADFRELGDTISDTFDVVLTCDNSIAHCLKDDDLNAALVSMKTRLDPNGLLLLSMRDYNALITDKPRFNNQHVQDKPDGRRVVFQLWDWADDGRRYKMNQFLIREIEGSYDFKHFHTELRALKRNEIITAVRNAGFEEVSWHVPESSGYYQPIVTARKP